jgi:membrane-bound lytic murein transglycosylase F
VLLPTIALAACFSGAEPKGTQTTEWELTRHTRERYTGDLDEIKKRGVLRILTRNNSSAYFISKGQQYGFQFELAQALAKELGVRLAVVVPPSRDNLIQALEDGEGDLIAAGMTVTGERGERVSFTYPVLESPRVLVTHPLIVKQLEQPEHAAQFAIHLNFNSTTLSDARALEKKIGLPLSLFGVEGGIEMEDMLARVASGEYEATIVDRDIFELERASGVEIFARIELDGPHAKAWAVRKSSPVLRDRADKFLRREHKTGLIRILHNKYFVLGSRATRVARDPELRADEEGRLSPFDELFKKEAAANELDWRLLVAVAHTESKLDAEAKSPFGAIGLMQVLPSTGQELGVADVTKPEDNIRAGARYIRKLIDAFGGEGLEERQQIRFALASYNVGLGHVRDARVLAEQTGKDKNRWFGNVEQALLLKKDPRWHEKTRSGYCRADEPVQYVSRVQASYDIFVRHVSL